MGHLCSCHRQPKYDKGYFIDNSQSWKTDVSLIRKLRWRCSYLRGSSSRSTTFPVANSPLPVSVVGRRHPHDDAKLSMYPTTEADECASGLSSDRLRSSSSPSSPVPRRSAPPKPPRMRSMLVDDSSSYQPNVSDRRTVCRRSSTSQLHVSTASGDVTLESASFSAVDECTSSSGHVTGVADHPSDGCAIDAVSRHATDLLVTSGVQPEVLVDFLRRRDVINDDTSAAVRRSATRGAACELLAEVVASKGDAAVSALGDALRMAGSACEFPDCLEAVAALLRHPSVTSLSRFRSCSCRISPSNEDRISSSIQSTDETRTGNCSIDVEVVYVSPTAADAAQDQHAITRNDVTSGFRNRRHRSMFVDPETISLPPSRLAAADSEKHGGLPVVSVSFVNICLDDELSDILADALFRFRSVRVLSFVKCHRIGASFTRLLETAGKRSSDLTDGYHLHRLKIRLCSLSGTDDERVIADFAGAACRKLRELFVTGSGITSIGCDAIASGIVTGSRYLTDVDVGFNDISDVGCVADALAGNCSLRRLRMRGNAIGAICAARIFDALRRNYRLELLDISGNPIGESRSSGARGISSRNAETVRTLWAALAEALLCNRTLRQLNLERCGLGIDACLALTRALRANTTLTDLDLSMNPDVGDLGVAILAGALRQNRRSAIQVLSLNMCAVGNVGLRSLLDAIRFLGKEGGNTTRLRRIKLCYNLIDGDSGRGRRQSTRLDIAELRRRRSSLEQTASSTRPVSACFRFDSLMKKSPSTAAGGAGWMKRMDDGTLAEGEELLDWEGPANAGDSNISPAEAPKLDDCEENSFLTGRMERSSTVGEQMAVAAPELAASAMKVVHSCIDVRRNADKSEVVLGQTSTKSGTGSSAAAGSWHSTSRAHAASDEHFDNERRRTMASDAVHPHQLGRSASAILDSRHGRGDYGRTELKQALNASDGSTMFACDDKDDDPEQTSSDDVYGALCDVLASNPGLKILLWGNQLTSSGIGKGGDESRRDSTFVAESDSSMLDLSGAGSSRGVDGGHGRTVPDAFSRSRHQYATLPRNYELGVIPTSSYFS